MSDERSFKKLYEQEVNKQVTRRLTTERLSEMRSQCVGGTGFSAAIIFLLLQTEMDSAGHGVSLWCSAISIPIWITCWQMTESYLFAGEESYEHFSSVEASLVGILLFLVAMTLVFVSMVSLLWTIHRGVSISFAVACFVAAAYIFRYHNKVRRFADEKGPKRNGG
jgi:hypothetical protein